MHITWPMKHLAPMSLRIIACDTLFMTKQKSIRLYCSKATCLRHFAAVPPLFANYWPSETLEDRPTSIPTVIYFVTCFWSFGLQQAKLVLLLLLLLYWSITGPKHSKVCTARGPRLLKGLNSGPFIFAALYTVLCCWNFYLFIFDDKFLHQSAFLWCTGS